MLAVVLATLANLIKSHISKHLHGKMTCFDSHNLLFKKKTIDKSNYKFLLKNQRVLDINWKKPNLNAH